MIQKPHFLAYIQKTIIQKDVHCSTIILLYNIILYNIYYYIIML